MEWEIVIVSGATLLGFIAVIVSIYARKRSSWDLKEFYLLQSTALSLLFLAMLSHTLNDAGMLSEGLIIEHLLEMIAFIIFLIAFIELGEFTKMVSFKK